MAYSSNGGGGIPQWEPHPDVAPGPEWREAKEPALPPRDVTVRIVRLRKGHGVEEYARYLGDGWWKVYGTRVKHVLYWRPLEDE